MKTFAKFGAVLLVSTVASLQAPAPASADGPCTDAAWARYNSCLMSHCSEWGKVMCDLEFRLAYAVCAEEIE